MGIWFADIDKVYEYLKDRFKDCGDFIIKTCEIGREYSLRACFIYLDGVTDNDVVNGDIVANLITEGRLVYMGINGNTSSQKAQEINRGGISSVDKKHVYDIEDAVKGVLDGDTALFVEGLESIILVNTKKYPTRGVNEPDAEVVVRGPKDAFTEPFRTNTALIRRRIKDTSLKLLQHQIGERSQTKVGIMYMEDLVRPEIKAQVIEDIHSFEIDAILDSGQLEELIENKWYSPFPTIQATVRPDKVASGLLEGRVAIIVDNSPFVLLVPATLNCFFQASDDYYSSWGIMAFTRVIRYIAAFIAIGFSGLYLAVTTFHNTMLPTNLLLSFAGARVGVPFPALIEVLIMEIAFELLREAGIRLPAPIGSTIGIVGGLIVGQAAVDANLVSPIVVIIVSLGAIATFAIPNEEFTGGIRLCKFFTLILSAFLGFLGFWIAIICIFIHLASLRSYGFPYLMPYVASSVEGADKSEDSIIRMPIRKMKKRPIFTKKGERTKFKD